MLFKKNSEKFEKIAQTPVKTKRENPKICLEFLPDGKVIPSVSWEPHSNVNVKLVSDVINLLNEGKLYDAIRNAVIHQGAFSGDVELANAIHKNIKNPQCIDDERPIIPASMVTRFHFSQQRTQTNDGE
jgi:hypothetical protein